MERYVDATGQIAGRLASFTAKQLLKGARPLVNSDNKEVVSALREIAEGKVGMQYPEVEEE